MLPPLESAKLSILAAKDVYYVTRYIYRTVDSACHRDKELETLLHGLKLEKSYLDGFGRRFLEDLDPEDPGNKYWLPIVHDINQKIWDQFPQNVVRRALEETEYKKFDESHNLFIQSSEESQGLLAWPQDNAGLSSSVVEEATDDGDGGLLETEVQALTPAATPSRRPAATTSLAPATPSASAQCSATPPSSGDDSWTPLRLKRDNLHRISKDIYARTRWAIVDKRQLEKFLASLQGHTSNLRSHEMSIKDFHPKYRGVKEPQKIVLQLPHLGPHVAIQALAQQADQAMHRPTIMPEAVQKYVSEPEDLSVYSLTPDNARQLTRGRMIGNDGRATPVLIEYKNWRRCTDANYIRESKDELKLLAKVLATAKSPEFRTLHMRGYANQDNRQRFAFVFDFPKDAHPEASVVTLGELLKEASVPLPSKFKIARQVVSSIRAFHQDEWLHQGIHSDSVVFFKDRYGNVALESPYLTGFEHARPDTAAWTTYSSISKDGDKAFYQHPDRMASSPPKFCCNHDLYALGVVLLQIGLWRPVSSIYDTFKQRLLDSGTASGATQSPSSPPQPDDHRRVFIDAASTLSGFMGPHYQKAVLACLSDNHRNVVSESPSLGLMDRLFDLVDISKIISDFYMQFG